MTINTCELEPAIAAITREEPHWDAVHLLDKPARTIQISRVAGDSYFSRVLTGYSEVEGIEERLAAVSPKFITATEALRMRTSHDAQWAVRPALQQRFGRLAAAGFFKTDEAGNLRRLYVTDSDVSTEPDHYTLEITAEGAISMRVDYHPASDHLNALAWQSYDLKRGTSKCEHAREYPPREPEPFIDYNGSNVVVALVRHLGALEALVANESVQ